MIMTPSIETHSAPPVPRRSSNIAADLPLKNPVRCYAFWSTDRNGISQLIPQMRHYLGGENGPESPAKAASLVKLSNYSGKYGQV